MASERVSIDLSHLQAQISQFAEDRNWEQFRRPKNLAMALAAEAESPGSQESGSAEQALFEREGLGRVDRDPSEVRVERVQDVVALGGHEHARNG